MGGGRGGEGRGGVVREVGEHSSVALAAVSFLSFPIPLLRLCWGFIAIFVSFTRFCCPLAIHYHFRVIYNDCDYLAPIVSPPPPYCPSRIPPPPQTSLPEAFSGQISLNGSEDRHRNKKQCLSILFVLVFIERESQLIHVMAKVCIDFLDLLNIGTVEFGLCELARLLE